MEKQLPKSMSVTVWFIQSTTILILGQPHKQFNQLLGTKNIQTQYVNSLWYVQGTNSIQSLAWKQTVNKDGKMKKMYISDFLYGFIV